MTRSRILLVCASVLPILAAASTSCSKEPTRAPPSHEPPAADQAVPAKPASAEAHADTKLIFRDASGRQLTTADLAHVTGHVDYRLVGGEDIPDGAQQLFQQGQRAGGAGDYPKALELFGKARDAAPRWPYPVYEIAYTHQLMDQPAEALTHYDAVLKLAPRGFFTALSSADCLRREAAHEWAPGVCKQYMMIEWLDEGAKLEALRALLAKVPSLAPAWKDLAFVTKDDAERLKAYDSGLAHHPDPETRGVILANKALVLERAGKHAEAIEMLGNLALDPAAPLDVVEIAKLSLSQIAVR